MTISFKEFLTEGFKNLFTPEQKRKYADEAYEQLQQSYKKVGGLKGGGFKDVEDFVNNIPFWKLRFNANGKLIAASYYKDKGGRKRVALSSDGTPEGKKYVMMMMVEDLAQGRAYGEVSAASLNFAAKMLGYDTLKKFAMTPEKLKQVTNEEIFPVPKDDVELQLHPELKDYFYQREISGELHTKIAFGVAGHKIG